MGRKILISNGTKRNALGRRAAILLASSALGFTAGCASGGATNAVAVRYVGATGFRQLSPAAVEIRKERETRPHDVIAELSVPNDGDSSFETLVQRLRERAALLGADELAEVIAVYDIPTTGTAVTSSNTGLPSQAGLEAASTGFSLLIHHPKWVSVRGIALRLHEKHLADRSFSVHDPTDSRPSPLQDAHRVGAPPTPPCGPAEKPPADQPNNEE